MFTTQRRPPSRNRAARLAALLVGAVMTGAANAAVVSLDVLQRDGYGAVEIKRPRPNVLTVLAELDGRKVSLMIDSGWTGEGIGLQGGSAARAVRVTLGNVQLAQVPISAVDLDARANQVSRRATGAGGVIGAGFLRACSGILDLQNLKLYLKPPGHGRRASIGPGLIGAGMAEVPFVNAGPRECLVPVEVNGHSGRMFVDTGSYLAAVDARLASQIGARPFVTRAGHRRPQTMDEFERVTRIDARSREVAALVENAPVTPLQSLKIGGVPARAPDIRLRKFDFYTASSPKAIGVLGMDILGANGAIIDFAAQRLYFLPAR
jgi:hypothetical protein